MISRCPSCGAQVDDEAKQCPKCFWNFVQLPRLPPADRSAPRSQPPLVPDAEAALERIYDNLAQPQVQPPLAPAAEAAPAIPARPSSPPARPVEAPRTGFSAIHWFVAGAIVVGVVFVVATYIALRPETVVESRRPVHAVFPKEVRRDLFRVPAPREDIIVAESKKTEPTGAPSWEAAPAPAAAVSSATAPVPQAPAQPAPAPAASPAAPKSAAAKPKPGPHWVFEGCAYDIISLRAVYAAQLVFRDASGRVRGETATGEEGRYRIALEPLPEGGYALSVKHPDYQEKYIDEIFPPFKEVAAQERRRLVNMTARVRPWVGQTSGPVRRDFVMIPKQASEPAR